MQTEMKEKEATKGVLREEGKLMEVRYEMMREEMERWKK